MRLKHRSPSAAIKMGSRHLLLTGMQRFARLVALQGAVSCAAIFVSGAGAAAQAPSTLLPENAEARSYGDGWQCARSFRREGNECVAITIPTNAYATNRTYGSGWSCLHGFQEVDGANCVEVKTPEGSYLDPSGKSWSCLRGYTQVNDLCVEVVLPANAYLADNTFGSVWLCERGYQRVEQTCAPIEVPENAYLDGSSYGKKAWTCERGYVEREGACEAVVIPENAYFFDASYGPGWKCNRGFAPTKDSCIAIELPDNAHLNRAGDKWECHRNFQRSKDLCVLND